ncbi:MAG: HlyC/CorC family transporter [Anaerolineae bacterium]|nr:HlyC/CorC family transporter [Anaerolineae bacterium]
MEPSDSTGGLLALAALVIIHASLTAIYFSVINARKQNLRELADGGNRRAARVLSITEDSTRLITTQHLINVIFYFVGAGLGTVTIAQPLAVMMTAQGMSRDAAHLVLYPLVWVSCGIVIFVLTDLIPTTLASSRSEMLAMSFGWVVGIALKLFSPSSSLLMRLGNRIAGALGGEHKTPYVTEEEIKTLVDAGQEGGAIEDEEKEMIYSILQFNDKVVREIMVPRIDVEALEAKTTAFEALQKIIVNGHSRIPVYEDVIDKVIGVLYAKDMLGAMFTGGNRERPIREMARPAYFVPESKQASELLAELQKSKVHMAIVIDEYGGTAGLVTIEDLLEEIVGEIQDEFDPEEEAEFQMINENEYLFDGGIDLDEVNELLHVRLSTDESDTLGGFVFASLGRVPIVGDNFETDGLTVTVESINARRIRRVKVVRNQPPTEIDEAKPSRTTQTLPKTPPESPASDSDSPTDKALNGTAIS